MAATAEQVRETAKLLTQLEKTRKTLRLYQTDNEVCRRQLAELGAATGRLLESWGACELAVGEDALRLDDEVVAESADRTDSLVFLLFRDGVRRLTLLPGLEPSELKRFVEAVNRASIVANQEDDLVTLFWEQDFRSIRYHAVEELDQTAEGPRLTEQLAAGSLPVGQPSQGVEKVRIDDLKRPVAMLPAEECRLREREIEAIHAELAALDAEDPLVVSVELAVELILVEEAADERRAIRQTVLESVWQALAAGGLTSVTRALQRLEELAGKELAGEAEVHALRAELIQALSTPQGVELALDGLERDPESTSPSALTVFLARLGAPALPALVRAVGNLLRPEYRRAVTVAILAAGEPGLALLEQRLAADEPSAELVAEALFAARQAGGDAGVPLIRRLLAVPQPEIRRQAAVVLGPYRAGPGGETWALLLGDEDGEIRRLALTVLVRSGQPQLAQIIAERTMSAEFTEAELEEKRRTFAAIARLGGEQGLPWFEELLRRPNPRWFASRTIKETLAAVAHGVATVRSANARELLERLAVEADRTVRVACRDALAELDDGT